MENKLSSLIVVFQQAFNTIEIIVNNTLTIFATSVFCVVYLCVSFYRFESMAAISTNAKTHSAHNAIDWQFWCDADAFGKTIFSLTNLC